jgi:hypothetical protein
MDVGMLVLRLFHVGLGVFWAGTILFFVLLLEPSIREAGPEGGKVMQALVRRGYLNIMPGVALLTVLSGVDLLRRVSAGFSAEWMGSATGRTLLLGSLTGTLALVLGIGILRPTALRVGRLMQAAGAVEAGAEKDRLMQEVGALRARVTASARVIGLLLAITVVTMAVARYL